MQCVARDGAAYPPGLRDLPDAPDALTVRGALPLGGIAIVGGRDASSPACHKSPEHAALADAIVAAGGALATELDPDVEALDWTLMRRDRLQAAHAMPVVLIESDAAGGARHTLAFARACGRPRFALVGEASGNARALADGAIALPWNVAAAARRIRLG